MTTIIRYDVLSDSPQRIVVRDLSNDDPSAKSLTNGAEELVLRLWKAGRLKNTKRLYYIDTDNSLDEMEFDGEHFIRFRALDAKARATLLVDLQLEALGVR